MLRAGGFELPAATAPATCNMQPRSDSAWPEKVVMNHEERHGQKFGGVAVTTVPSIKVLSAGPSC